MTTVIAVPPSLDEHSFEQVLEQLAPLPADAKLLVDARHARWASPYGLTALLTLGQAVAETDAGPAAPAPADGAAPVKPAGRKFCTNCGAPLAPNAKFCTKCGQKVGG